MVIRPILSLLRLTDGNGQPAWFHLSCRMPTWVLHTFTGDEEQPTEVASGQLNEWVELPPRFQVSHQVPMSVACEFAGRENPGIGPGTLPTWLAILDVLEVRIRHGTLEEFRIHHVAP
jgi:hypothetical protein